MPDRPAVPGASKGSHPLARGPTGALEELIADLGVAGPTGPTELKIADLLQTLVEVTAAIGRLQTILMILAEQVEADDTVITTGWASTEDLLTHLTGGRKGAGGGILRLAEQTATLPQVREAMLAGGLSPAQARTIARRVSTLPADAQIRTDAAQVMIGQVDAESLDATDLDRAFTSVIAAVDPDGSLLGAQEQLRPAHERGALARHLSLVPDEVGGVTITGYAGIEDAELVRMTLASLAAPVSAEPGACGGDPDVDWFAALQLRETGQPVPRCPTPGCRHDGRDPRDHGARLLDALVEVCRRAQGVDHGPDRLPRHHGTSARITVTVEHQALLDQVGTGLLGSGQRICADGVRRLACDSEVLPAVLGSRGEILDLGRTRRLVTSTLWLAVVLRDQHCTFPGCRRPPQACEAHHLVHWSDGGPTSLDNLALLCRTHHTLTHRSPWVISIDPVTRRPVWTPPPRTAQPFVGRLCPPLPSSRLLSSRQPSSPLPQTA